MASVTLARPDLFPDGTSVGAYPRPSPKFPLPGLDRAPIGAADGSATVTAGSVTITGLTDGTRYELVGLVGGEYRRIYVKTPETNTGLVGVQTAVTAPNGLAHPKWRQRRRALGLV